MTTDTATQIIETQVVRTNQGTRPVELAGYASFIILIATMMFVDSTWSRLPIIGVMTFLVLVFGLAQIFDRQTRLPWRLASLTMVSFVLWHVSIKTLFVIFILVVAIRLILGKPTPLC